MTETLLEVTGFGLKVLWVALVGGITVALLSRRRPSATPSRLRVRRINDGYDALTDTLRSTLLGRREMRRFRRRRDKERRSRPAGRNVFVVDFEGDVEASAVDGLRTQVSSILGVADDGDEMVVRLQSAGGLVHAYGLAASQLERVRERGLKLTVCVDRVAASGGYMMACLAETLIAAPFAIVGSIGVVASVPNVHRLLSERGVDYEELTAGEHKRTVSTLGRITDEGRRHFQSQLEDTHALFKQLVGRYRPQLDLDAVATGEYWFARRALDLKLVDRLMTSDDYVLSCLEEATVYEVSTRDARAWPRRLRSLLGPRALPSP